MKLYFQSSSGEERLIHSDIHNEDEAFKAIKAFCSERNFKIYYYRAWTQEGVTTFDVGRHTEFFKLYEGDSE